MSEIVTWTYETPHAWRWRVIVRAQWTGVGELSREVFLSVIMMPMFLPACMSLSLLLPAVLRSLGPRQRRQGRCLLLQPWNHRPGYGGSSNATRSRFQPWHKTRPGLGHGGALPWPAGACGELAALRNSGPPPIPTGGTGLRGQVGQAQPWSLLPCLPTGQQGLRARTLVACAGDARPLPRRAWLGPQASAGARAASGL